MMGTVDQAQSLINAMNYPQLGTRSTAFGIAHVDYTLAVRRRCF